MVYGDVAIRIKEVRKLAGRLSAHIAPDEDVTVMLTAADSWLSNKTGKKWDVADDDGFALALKASNYIAGAELINSQANGDTDKANGLRVAARDFVKGLNHKDTEVQAKGTAPVSVGVDLYHELQSDNYMEPIARRTTGQQL